VRRDILVHILVKWYLHHTQLESSDPNLDFVQFGTKKEGLRVHVLHQLGYQLHGFFDNLRGSEKL
jgi:hypothetical protein